MRKLVAQLTAVSAVVAFLTAGSGGPASARPLTVTVKDCYHGAVCSNADYEADDVSLACSRTAGFLKVEYDAAITPAPTTADQTMIANAYAYAYDAFQRGGDPLFATEMDEIYLSVTAPRFPAQWRIYSNDPGRYYTQETITQQRHDIDIICQYVD